MPLRVAPVCGKRVPVLRLHPRIIPLPRHHPESAPVELAGIVALGAAGCSRSIDGQYTFIPGIRFYYEQIGRIVGCALVVLPLDVASLQPERPTAVISPSPCVAVHNNVRFDIAVFFTTRVIRLGGDKPAES
jgi:hypothetical protein